MNRTVHFSSCTGGNVRARKMYGAVRKAGSPRSYIVAFEPMFTSLPGGFC